MAKKFDFLSPGINIREIDQSFIPQEAEAEGPIIIGRTRKGPANKPVRIRNLDDFVSVFGLPVAGGNGTLGDMWREGNTVGPTYASYAAQSWLASENSPITVVRLAGEQHEAASDTGYAGWQVGTAGIGTDGNNSTAYGLFICDSADTAEASSQTLDFNTFDVTKLGEVASTPAYGVLSFFHKAALASSPALNVAGGLVFQINFDETATKGEIVKLSNAGGQGATGFGRNQTGGVVNVYSIGIASTPSETEVIGFIKTAIEQALTNGDISDISVENNGTSLKIYNLSTTKEFNLADKGRTGGGNTSAYANFRFGADMRNAFGTEIAVATRGVSNGSLAAVLYCATGSLVLSGPQAPGGSTVELAGTLVDSVGPNLEFTMKAFDNNGTLKDTLTFNFSRNSSGYIRNVLNTNPQLTNSTMIDSEDLKTYWLGESFLDHLDQNVDLSATAGNAHAILMPLGTGTGATANWGYHRYSAREAKSGWIISDRSTEEVKLFRFKSMHVGEDIQRNYLIAIEDITIPTNPSVDAYGSFTVCFKTVGGEAVERYTACNLNPASPNYVAARIGDQYQEWSDTDKRYRTYGDFQNQSNIFYIEMAENVANGGGQGLTPAGFYGPVRPKTTRIVTGENAVQDSFGATLTATVIQSGEDGSLVKGHTLTSEIANLNTFEAVQFEFPKLRMRNNGSDGGASDQARTYWGIRPKLSAQSTQHDPDYVDYTRGLGMGQGIEGSHAPGTGFEYSFIFSLNDVSGSTGTDGGTAGVWTWASGNFGSNSSFTSNAGVSRTFADLLDQNVRQFIMPVWGGSEGFDITEMEPLRNELIATNGSLAETSNYVDYTISKALDSVSDEEVVPANLLTMPGIFARAATNKMINIAESRKDVLAIIDLEGDYRPRVEKKATSVARLGSVTDALSNIKQRNLNSSYACAFYPAVQVSDNLNGGQLVWLPASVAGLGAMGKSQATSELWFAPAGFNRGGLGSLGGSRGPRVLQARQRLDSKERDLLYERNINPIATFPAEGVVIFGQKTLQADASALDRINVRRLLLFLKSEVSAISRNLLFDQNLESTWARFKSQVEPVLSSTRARFGLSDYKVVLDNTTTTADLIDRNIMYAKIFVKPARAIEYIVVDFVITRTGADFV